MIEKKCPYHKIQKPCAICLEDRRLEKQYIKEQRELARKYRENAARDEVFANLDASEIFSNIFD